MQVPTTMQQPPFSTPHAPAQAQADVMWGSLLLISSHTVNQSRARGLLAIPLVGGCMHGEWQGVPSPPSGAQHAWAQARACVLWGAAARVKEIFHLITHRQELLAHSASDAHDSYARTVSGLGCLHHLHRRAAGASGATSLLPDAGAALHAGGLHFAAFLTGWCSDCFSDWRLVQASKRAQAPAASVVPRHMFTQGMLRSWCRRG